MQLRFPRPSKWNWWHIPLCSGIVIAAFFCAWEALEFTFLHDIPLEARRWLYLGRGIFGAVCIGMVTGVMVRRHERRQAAMRQAIVQNEKLAAIGQMAAGLAHEIGNPLAAISSVVQLIERGPIPETEAAKLRLIHGEIDRINRIVRQLVDFARPESYDPRPLNVVHTLNEAIELARYDPRAGGIRFERRYAPNLPPVRAVREHLIQIFLNILYNAMDAMPRGGSVVIRATPADGVLLEFQDTGEGIPTDRLEQVFRPFYTTKPRGHGSGLGLAVTRHLITVHHGRIALESRVGAGTTVRITLPAHEEPRGANGDGRHPASSEIRSTHG